MLRARKKDARIKPNRKLDKRSSRGMLYENEELRLRTIEINAEVERGQTDIKKLRRENDHLRREMWALRDEYERLEKLIKHLDLAGTGSENSQRGHHHSDGEGGGRGSSRMSRGGDDDDQASMNGCIESCDEDSGASDTEERNKKRCVSEPAVARSKSQTILPGGSATPAAASNSILSSSNDSSCKCHQELESVGGSGLYVECGNPVKDNIVNYQKAYGRMPGGSKIYVSTQHFHPTSATTDASPSTSSRGCYESLAAVKGSHHRYSTGSGMEDEDGYAACSHPVTVQPACLNSFTDPSGVMPPQPSDSPPPLPPPLRRTGGSGLEVPQEEVEMSSVGSDEELASCGVVDDTPSEDDCHFNLDHLVDVVRSFQQEKELHQSGLVVATCTPITLSATSLVPTSEVVVIEEASNEDEDLSSSSNSSSGAPEASGVATIKRRPLPTPQQHQRHRQVAIIEREPVGIMSSVGDISSPYPAGRGLIPLRRNSFSSTSSSSSSSGSPTGGSTVVFLNNNNNNNNSLNNNKSGSSGHINVLRGEPKVSRSKGSSPIRIALPAPSSSSAGDALDQQPQEQAGCLSLYPLPDGDASASLLRLHAVDPHTVSFDLSKVEGFPLTPLEPSVTVQEVIDQLDRQLEPELRSHIRGVRCVLAGGLLFFISLDSARSVRKLMRSPFMLRGYRIALTDVSAQTWIVSLSGVPHYISDATVGLLLAAFGTIVGDVERRFFRGMDTGERLVRFRLKGHSTKLPRHITVGGCRIQVRRMSPTPQPSAGSASSAAGSSVRSRSVSNPSGMDRRISGDQTEVTVASAEMVLPSGKVAEATYLASSKSSTGSGTKIGRSFEYRSQLRVDLRMSAEVPAPPPLTDESPIAGTSSRITPPGNCSICEQMTLHSGYSGKCQHTPLPPPNPPPTLVVHRCRHHHVTDAAGSNCGTPSGSLGKSIATVLRESPPKTRVSVNFDESVPGGTGGGSRSNTKSRSPASASTSTCNGILRKSVSGEDAAAIAAAAGSNSESGTGEAGNPGQSGDGGAKNKVMGLVGKKTARSFSLVDTFRTNRERRGIGKPVIRVDTLVEASNNPAEVVTTTLQRRDSAESSSRSSRSSRKSNELPWCGCWGNGCL